VSYLLFDPTLDYAMRCHRLTTNKIALWDVLKSCHRPGSLDAAISDTGLKINDFGRLFPTSSTYQAHILQWQKGGQLIQQDGRPTSVTPDQFLHASINKPGPCCTELWCKAECLVDREIPGP